MTAGSRFRNPRPLSDLLGGVLDPVLRKRAGMTVSLLQSWEAVVGPFAAARSRPEKLAWPRKAGSRDAFGAATLVIACEPSTALELQHETTEIIARVNGFLGANAVGKVKLVQKPVNASATRTRPKPRPLDRAEKEAIARLTAGIEDDALRASLERLGATVKGTRRPPFKSP